MAKNKGNQQGNQGGGGDGGGQQQGNQGGGQQQGDNKKGKGKGGNQQQQGGGGGGYQQQGGVGQKLPAIYKVTIPNVDLSFEDANIALEYKTIQTYLNTLQGVLSGQNVESDLDNVRLQMQHQKKSMYETRQHMANSIEKIQTSLNDAISRVDKAESLLEAKGESIARMYHSIQVLSEMISNFVSHTNAENARLRSINVVQGTNLRTVSGKKCITEPVQDATTGKYYCQIDEKVKAKPPGLLNVFASERETSINQLGEVDPNNVAKYISHKKNYETLYNFGGMGNTKLMERLNNITKFVVGEEFTVISNNITVKAHTKVGDDFDLPVPVGTIVRVSQDLNLGAGAANPLPANHIKVSIVLPKSDKISDRINQYGIDYGKLKDEKITIDVNNLGKITA